MEFADGYKAYFIHGYYFNEWQFNTFVRDRTLTENELNMMDFEERNEYIVYPLRLIYAYNRPDQFPVKQFD